MSLLETLLTSMTSSSSLDTMSRRTGGNNEQMAALITAALPILLRALTANASIQSGAASLNERPVPSERVEQRSGRFGAERTGPGFTQQSVRCIQSGSGAAEGTCD